MLCPRFIVSIQRHEEMDRIIVIQGKPQSQRLHACQLFQLADLHFVSRDVKTHDRYWFVDSWNSFYSCKVRACWPNDALLIAGRGCTVRQLIHTGFAIAVFVLFNSIGSHHQLSLSLLFEQEPLWPGMAVTALVFVLLSGTKKPFKVWSLGNVLVIIWMVAIGRCVPQNKCSTLGKFRWLIAFKVV